MSDEATGLRAMIARCAQLDDQGVLCTDEMFEEELMKAMTEPIGEPCCADFGRTLHHHWGRSTPSPW